jgi:hypothetical protein
MSYPGSPEIEHGHDGSGAIAVGGVGGVIVMGRGGLITQTNTLGNIPDANFGDTSGPNAVNPSGRSSGIRHAQQNNFGRKR